MEKIITYNVRKGMVKFLLIGGLILFFVGAAMTFKSLIGNSESDFMSGNTISFILMFNGVIFLGAAYMHIRFRTYFFGWDNQQISFMLPGMREPQNIFHTKLQLAEVNGKLVNIFAEERTMTFNLDVFGEKDFERIIDKLKHLSNSKAIEI